MYKNNDPCPICGDGRLRKKSVRETFEYKGESLTLDDYIIYECQECEEAIVDPKSIKKTEKPVRDFHRKVDGLLTSDEIKAIRTALGYTQEQFGKILGGGAKSFARYENGTVTQSKPMDNLLRIVKQYPEVLNVLNGKGVKQSISHTDDSPVSPKIFEKIEILPSYDDEQDYRI